MVMFLEDESTYNRHTMEKITSFQGSISEGPGGRWNNLNESLKTEQDWGSASTPESPIKKVTSLIAF